MGCWNATCNVSNLPIYAGDKIVVIPLMQKHDEMETNTCYATDNFAPYALPIFGEYNDYGGIENISTHPMNEKLLRYYEYYSRRPDGIVYEKINHTHQEDFQEFVNRIICVCDTYVKMENNIYKNKMAKISFFMVHQDVYNLLIREAGNRKPYHKKETYKDLLIRDFEKYIDKYKEDAVINKHLFKDMENIDKEKVSAMRSMLSESSLHDLAKSVFGFGEMLLTSCLGWSYFIQECIDNNCSSIAVPAVEKALFTQALSLLRKGYHCESGMGSQSQETRIHYVLAEYIIHHIQHYAKKYNAEVEDDDNCISDEGVEETLFYF